ncbi:hypothetical protein N7528_003247 [Penicillium herquei]|nr:hypothetical protein N7528_003247 [Penicillium herquei]
MSKSLENYKKLLNTGIDVLKPVYVIQSLNVAPKSSEYRHISAPGACGVTDRGSVSDEGLSNMSVHCRFMNSAVVEAEGEKKVEPTKMIDFEAFISRMFEILKTSENLE